MTSAVLSGATIAIHDVVDRVHSRHIPLALALGAAAVLAAGRSPMVVLLLYLALVTPALWESDLRCRRLPNKLVLPGYAVLSVVVLLASIHGENPWLALANGAAWFGGTAFLALLGGMGMGDVKLAGLLGVGAGSVSVVAAVTMPFLVLIPAGIVAAVMMATRRDRTIAFGPYLLAGMWATVLLAAVVPYA